MIRVFSKWEDSKVLLLFLQSVFTNTCLIAPHQDAASSLYLLVMKECEYECIGVGENYRAISQIIADQTENL